MISQDKTSDIHDETAAQPELEQPALRRHYEAPRLTKKRSVARVTLFSGGGATAGGLTAAG